MKFLLISDIHENIDNLKNALAKAEKLQCDEIICLGDIGGYGINQQKHYQNAQANACYEAIRKNCKWVVAGNHDMHIARRLPSFNQGFGFPENWYGLDIETKRGLGKQKVYLYEDDITPELSQENYRFVRDIPVFLNLKGIPEGIVCSHYIYPNINGMIAGFYSVSQELGQHWGFMDSLDATISFCGHGHPCGMAVFSKNTYKLLEFGALQLNKGHQLVVCPPLAKNNRFSGFITYNTVDKYVELYEN